MMLHVVDELIGTTAIGEQVVTLYSEISVEFTKIRMAASGPTVKLKSWCSVVMGIEQTSDVKRLL